TVGNAIFFGIGNSQAGTPGGVMAYTPLGAPPELPQSDDYACYRSTRSAPPFGARYVTLADAFETKGAYVRKPDADCNPADVDGEGIADATAHLVCYRINEKDGVRSRPVQVSNHFGSQTLTVRRARDLCVPSEQNHVSSALNIDHYKCYKASGAPSSPVVAVSDEFGSTTTVLVKPTAFCNPVSKNNEGI